MRINPLVVPLIAVLALPFALGLADVTNSAPPSSQPAVSTSGQTLPICLTCGADIQIVKTQALSDLNCGYFSHGADPYIVESGYCQRYRCSNGYYYTWSGWQVTDSCTTAASTATPCPADTCSNPQ